MACLGFMLWSACKKDPPKEPGPDTRVLGTWEWEKIRYQTWNDRVLQNDTSYYMIPNFNIREFRSDMMCIDRSDEMDRVVVSTYEVSGDKIWISTLYNADPRGDTFRYSGDKIQYYLSVSGGQLILKDSIQSPIEPLVTRSESMYYLKK